MSIFKKTETKTRSALRALSTTETQSVGGGINPQPLPPGHVPVCRK